MTTVNETLTGQAPPIGRLADIYDFRLSIPVLDYAGNVDQVLTARVPAGSTEIALAIGRGIAEQIMQHTGRPVRTDGITAENVDEQPGPDELAALLATITADADHHKRVVAAFAEKFGLLAYVSPEEYNAASPSTLVGVQSPFGPGMSFVTQAGFQALVAANIAGTRPQAPALLPPWEEVAGCDLTSHIGRQVFAHTGEWVDLNPVYDDVEEGVVVIGDPNGVGTTALPEEIRFVRDPLPLGPNGEEDPSVRRIRVGDLAQMPVPHQVQVLQASGWQSINAFSDGAEPGTVAVLMVDGSFEIAEDRIVYVRPAAWVARVDELLGKQLAGLEVLIGDLWRVLAGATPLETGLARLHFAEYEPEVDPLAAVLIRHRPVGWY